jgi:2-polyprenyl-6-methoxyphenol hydroxylase-like FAD-dependent oxidoreductase
LLRPARAVAFSCNGKTSLAIATDDSKVTCIAHLVVGADGKRSKTRQWTGGESVADPEHHRMGVVLLSGATIDRAHDNFAWFDCKGINWFAAGPEMTRLYVVMGAAQLRETGINRSCSALVDFAAEHMPEGVLIGDTAGAPDPTQGHGTSMIFRDVRALSELLLNDTDWDLVIDEFAKERCRAFDVIREVDRWQNVFFEMTDDAARLSEGHERARASDPPPGGFDALELTSPSGLVADEAARRHYFGEDLT